MNLGQGAKRILRSVCVRVCQERTTHLRTCVTVCVSKNRSDGVHSDQNARCISLLFLFLLVVRNQRNLHGITAAQEKLKNKNKKNGSQKINK